MKVYITGIAGFAASHLAEYINLKYPHYEVHGLLRSTSYKQNLQNVKCVLHEGDLQDYDSILQPLLIHKPSIIFHLASRTSVKYSFTNPITSLQDNVVGTLNLLEAIRFLKQQYGYDPVLMCCGSSEVFGKVSKEDLPITENHSLIPLSPYAVSKVTQEMYCRQYWESWQIKTIVSRAFSHIGIRQNPLFVVPNFVRQAVEIKKGLIEPILNVGNLDSIRTFCDVRDIASAYWLLATKGEYGQVYNICGDESFTIKEILTKICNKLDISPQINIDSNRIRPSDVTLQIPDCSKFKKQTGWAPKYKFDESLDEVIREWEQKIINKKESI